MSERVIRILKDGEYRQFADIFAASYPSLEVFQSEDKEKLVRKMLDRSAADDQVFGVFEDEILVGGMRLIDLTMNFRGVDVPAAGLGMVAVDPMHRKRKIARDIVRYFLAHARERNCALALLYAFRADFYRGMGFGYGAKVSRYTFIPAALPDEGRNSTLRLLGPNDANALARCFEEKRRKTHGMVQRRGIDFIEVLSRAGTCVIGREGPSGLSGYLVFDFEASLPGRIASSRLHIRELEYLDPESLKDILKFVRQQMDQVDRVIIETQDDAFHYLLTDPRDDSDLSLSFSSNQSNTQGLGLMYQVVNNELLMEIAMRGLPAGSLPGLTLTIRSGFAETADAIWTNNRDSSYPDQVSINTDIASWSSLLVGAVGLRDLERHGLARVSGDIDRLAAVLDYPEMPICTAQF